MITLSTLSVSPPIMEDTNKAEDIDKMPANSRSTINKTVRVNSSGELYDTSTPNGYSEIIELLNTGQTQFYDKSINVNNISWKDLKFYVDVNSGPVLPDQYTTPHVIITPDIAKRENKPLSFGFHDENTGTLKIILDTKKGDNVDQENGQNLKDSQTTRLIYQETREDIKKDITVIIYSDDGQVCNGLPIPVSDIVTWIKNVVVFASCQDSTAIKKRGNNRPSYLTDMFNGLQILAVLYLLNEMKLQQIPIKEAFDNLFIKYQVNSTILYVRDQSGAEKKGIIDVGKTFPFFSLLSEEMVKSLSSKIIETSSTPSIIYKVNKESPMFNKVLQVMTSILLKPEEWKDKFSFLGRIILKHDACVNDVDDQFWIDLVTKVTHVPPELNQTIQLSSLVVR